jgi:hypothetical protein
MRGWGITSVSALMGVSMVSDLIPLYKEMAASGASFRGLSVIQHSKQIGDLVREHRAKNLLDYGAGAGDAYRSPHKIHREWGLRWFNVKLYDPAFPTHDEKPHGKFDGVICSDVLEHVPEADVDEFVKALFDHARKFVWASVCTRPAKKSFPGTETNLHVTLQPMVWWRDKFSAYADSGVSFYLVETP